MWASVGKFVGGKVVTAILVVGVAGGVIWFWKHPEDLRSIWDATKSAIAWLSFAAVLPWALFFTVPLVRKFDNNLAPAVMLMSYLAIDAVVALWLAEWSIQGSLSWVVVILGLLAAAVYNYLVAQTIDEHLDM